MNRLSLAGAVIASVFATNALAADLPVKAPPMVAPVFTWTGFYAGLNGGYSWGRASETLFPNSILATVIRQDVNGGVFGGQAGYNWQLDPKWVIGLEGDIQWTGERGRTDVLLGPIRVPTPGNDFNTVTTGAAYGETKLPWFATFRGRAGFLLDPSLLLYGTGGLAVGEVRFATQATVTQQLFGPGSTGTIPAGVPVTVVSPLFSDSQTRVGYAVGVGLEKKFGRNWSAKAEYLYVDFGSATYFGNTATPLDVRFRDNIFRVGFNYQFLPTVVAKY